jgi:hypothetical protein
MGSTRTNQTGIARLIKGVPDLCERHRSDKKEMKGGKYEPPAERIIMLNIGLHNQPSFGLEHFLDIFICSLFGKSVLILRPRLIYMLP